MNEHQVCADVTQFENVIKLSERLSTRRDDVTHLLCKFYAMWSALAILVRLRGFEADIKAARRKPLVESRPLQDRSLPSLDVVKSAVQRFMAAAASNHRAAMSTALQDMGVLALCPASEDQLLRMEMIAGFVSGRTRLIPLIDLALCAIELDNHERATKYAMQARAFDPDSWELYNLSVIEGLLALSEGKGFEAIQCLDKSINACQRDEYTSLSCGVRVPNLMLVEKLLHSGHRIEVLKHLLRCKNVWQPLSARIDKWISVIEDGETPDFRGAGIVPSMNLSYRLKMQLLRADSIEEATNSAAPKSEAEVLAARERLRAEYKHPLSGAINKRLKGF